MTTTIPAQCVQVGGTIIPATQIAAVGPLVRSPYSLSGDWWSFTVGTVHGQAYGSRAKTMIDAGPPAELVAEREAVLRAMGAAAHA